MSTNYMKIIEGSKCKIDADVWLDYSEKEISPTLASDLVLHSQDCLKCQSTLRDIELTRFLLKRTPEPELPAEEVFVNLEKLIAESVEKTLIDNPVTIKRAQLKVIFGATAAAFVLVFGSMYGPSVIKYKNFKSPSAVRQNSPEDQLMVESAHEDLEIFGDVIISHQDSDELVLDAAAEKLSRMSDQDARTMLDQIK